MEAEYEMVITKREKNPEFKPGKVYYNEREQEPQFLSTKELHTVLTETEFQAVKKSVLEVF